MKKIAFLLFIFITGIQLSAQTEEESSFVRQDDDFKTILGSNSIGGYGAFSVSYSMIDDRNGMVFSGRGGVVLGHIFAMGFGGSGFINEIYFNEELQSDASLSGGYGGIFFEPIIAPKFPVHISLPVLLGVGGVALSSIDRNLNDFNYWVEDSEAFFVIEPGVELEFNITRFFRFAIAGSYRFTNNISLYTYDNLSLNGFSGGVICKFGKF
ncbi:MAG: hypothetical protein JXJ22_02475 [Bacteroidales bacterium]|nr:hypothetical protein [Bacteroidales bacterium]